MANCTYEALSKKACENGEKNFQPISPAKENVVLVCTENWLSLLPLVPVL